MSESIAILDSSPLISLDGIGRLPLLREIFHQVLVPEAVAAELLSRHEIPPWIAIRAHKPFRTAAAFGPALGAGEIGAIELALGMPHSTLVLDDLPARRMATLLKLNVIGVLGLLGLAKRRGLIATVAPEIDRLVANGFRLTPNLRVEILKRAGEAVP